MRNLMVLVCTCALGLVTLSCSKDDSTKPDPSGDPLGTLSGVVEDVYGSPISGVDVRTGALTGHTNEQGWFYIPDVPVGDVLVAVERTGFLPTYRTTSIRQGQTTHLGTLVLLMTETLSVPADQGGTVETSDGAGTATFPPAAFVQQDGQPYVGDVSVEIAALRPGDPGFYGAFPGSFEGTRTDGSTVPFESFGFMGVNLSGSTGGPLSLAGGTEADLTILIPDHLSQTAPDTMPMWFFDETTGRWHEEGFAVREGTRYRAAVSHLSTWNWDFPIDDVCTVEGNVVSDQGLPVSDARVLSQGVTVTYLDEAFTDASGHFSVRALKNSTVEIRAIKGSYASEAVRIDVGQNCPVQLGTPLVLREPAFSVALRWGENPSDLDSHLFIPMTWDPNWDLYHIAYYSMGSLTEHPYTALDTDDTSSFGPEIISGFGLYEGRYSYFVHLFSGSGSISESPAVVDLEIAGQHKTYNASQAGGTVGEYWHVFDFVVAANRSVSITDVNRFAPMDFGAQRIYEGFGAARDRGELPIK